MLQSTDDANTDFYCAACSVVQSEIVTYRLLIYHPRTRNGRLGNARRVLVFGLAHGKPTHYHTAVV